MKRKASHLEDTTGQQRDETEMNTEDQNNTMMRYKKKKTGDIEKTKRKITFIFNTSDRLPNFSASTDIWGKMIPEPEKLFSRFIRHIALKIMIDPDYRLYRNYKTRPIESATSSMRSIQFPFFKNNLESEINYDWLKIAEANEGPITIEIPLVQADDRDKKCFAWAAGDKCRTTCRNDHVIKNFNTFERQANNQEKEEDLCKKYNFNDNGKSELFGQTMTWDRNTEYKQREDNRVMAIEDYIWD